MRKKIRDLRLTGYVIQHKEVIGLKYILFCICENREHVEIVLEKVTDFQHEELLQNNKILFVEIESKRNYKQNRYTIFYQESKGSTTIHAENMELYYSNYFMGEAGKYAVMEWNKRHICLPSLMVAILILESEKDKKTTLEIKELVRKRTDNLSAWEKKGALEDHGKLFERQKNYVIEAQNLQEAARRYSKEKEFEELLISTIEENRLVRFDA